MSFRITAVAAGLLAVATLLLPSCATPQPVTVAPIDWQPWTAASFERARSENRPILVCVEAVWCHWCHVMDAETYADPAVAKLVGERFLPIRVDSDRRPDVAERYAAWGWPATAVLTPGAEPVLERRGYQEKDAFLSLLQGVVDDLDAGRAFPRREEPAATALSGAADLATIRASVEASLDTYYDDDEGGWGRRQKYPLHAPLEQAFLRSELRREHGWMDRALTTAAGHSELLDPVWGGMYQYSERGVWDRPHFEKIVPVQAEGIESFVLAYHVTQDEAWLRRAELIDYYLHTFLRSHEGVYYTSQDADVGVHDVRGDSYVEGHEYFTLVDDERKARGMPRVDRNVYADRNGMVIAALAQLYRANREARVLEDARTAALRIESTHKDARGVYRHSADDETTLRHLSDQVEMARAFLALFELTADTRWRKKAEDLAALLLSDFQDTQEGGFYAHTPDPDATGVFAERRKPFRLNGRAARFLARLSYVTERPTWRPAAESTVRALGHADTIDEQGRGVGDFLMACEVLSTPPRRLTVVGWPDDARTTALFEAALSVRAPALVVELSSPGGRYPDTGAPTAYVCDESTCSSPLDNPRTLPTRVREFLDARP